MGLLQRLRGSRQASDKLAGPRSLARVLEAVVKHARALQVVLVLVGVLGLCLVPLLERSIEFDENALLAGSARPTTSFSSPSAYEAGKTFADSLQHTYNTFAFSPALQEALAAAGFAVSNHTFSTVAASRSSSRGGGGSSGSSSGSGSNVVKRECVNVHAVLHSPRGDGKEALVLVTPINHQHFSTDFQQDPSGVRLSLALGYALMTHLSRATWLSKEVIWLLPDASCGLVTAVEAWTDVYQLLPLDTAGCEPHFKRAGVLQQALLLELPSGAFNRVQVGLEGHAGQLPKLDMFWLYKWYSQAYVTAPVELPQLTYQLAAPLQAVYNTLLPLLPTDGSAAAAAAAVHGHLRKMQVMWQFMGRQAKGLPTGAHAAFKGLGVDAATLRVLVRNDNGQVVGPEGYTGGGNAGSVAAKQATPSTDGPYSQYGDLGIISNQQLVGFDSALLQLGNVMEASLRSCSVLIERFHHSLFLYVLTGLDHYVSVERYIGPLVALICVLVLQAAYISRLHSTAAPASAAAKGEQQQIAGNTQGLQGMLQAHALQVPADQPSAAVERQQWMSALQLVLLIHGLVAAVAAGLRHMLTPRTASHPALAFMGLERDAQLQLGSDPSFAKFGVQGLGVGVGLLLAIVVVGETVAGLINRSSAGSGSSSSSNNSSEGGVMLTKVLVVELSSAAAVLAAVACINWALGYMLCLVLVPLAFVSNVSSSSSSSWLHTALKVATLVGCSPVALLLALSANAAGVGVVNASQSQWLLWLACDSSWGTYMLACGLYVPLWVLAVASAAAPKDIR